MYSEESVNIPIAEFTTVKVENIDTEDPLLVTVQSGNQLYLDYFFGKLEVLPVKFEKLSFSHIKEKN